MISRRDLLTGAGATVLFASVVHAQRVEKVWRIGFLETPPITVNAHLKEALWQALRDRGYIDGRNLVIEARHADGHLERLDGMAAELVRLHVDVIVTTGTQATAAAKRATHMIPIVMTLTSDPVGTGLITSLSRPGGNVTGLTFIAPDLAAKRLALLKEATPRISRVAVLWNPDDPPRMLEYKETQTAAQTVGVALLSVQIRHRDELDVAFAAMARGHADAVVVLIDPLTNALRGDIATAAVKRGLPTMSEVREFVEAGGLVCYGPSFLDLFRRAAGYVDRILQGAKPGNLPVERPIKFELVINLKTAKALHVTIPPSLLLRADQIIE